MGLGIEPDRQAGNNPPWWLPGLFLAEARTWRDDCKALAGRGLSPMVLKRGDPIPRMPRRRRNLPNFYPQLVLESH